MVLPLRKGDAAVFAVNSRPMKGARGDYQVKLSHGVSKLYTGKRHTVGVIFHDADMTPFHSRSMRSRTPLPRVALGSRAVLLRGLARSRAPRTPRRHRRR